jgi:hypothetical protein
MFQVMSDLHLEVGRQYHHHHAPSPSPLPPLSLIPSEALSPRPSSSASACVFTIPRRAPYLILAGDVGRLADFDEYRAFVAAQCALFDAVFLVLGNHEFYGLSRAEGLRRADALQRDASMRGRLFVLNRTRVDLTGMAAAPAGVANIISEADLGQSSTSVAVAGNIHGDSIRNVYDIVEDDGDADAEWDVKGKRKAGVRLHRDSIDDDGTSVTILGCTLHSHVPPEARNVVRQKVSDFRRIADWTVEDHVAEHARDVAWLRRELRAITGGQHPANGETAPDATAHQDRQARRRGGGYRRARRRIVIVTHHAPMVRGTSHPQHVGSPWSSAFATSLLDDDKNDDDVSGGGPGAFSAVDCWVFGHTHYSTDFWVGGTRLVSNQRGYIAPGSITRAYQEPQSRRGWEMQNRRLYGRLISSAGLSQWFRRDKPCDAEERGGKPVDNVFDVHKVISV